MTKQSSTQKSLAILAVLLIVSSVGVTFADNTPTLNTHDDSMKVSEAKLDWEKIYGGASDDRALYTIPVENGDFLVVGTSWSIISSVMVGWALMLNQNGEEIWNQTYLTGDGTELRCALNLTDGFLLVGNTFLDSGNENGYVARTDLQGALIWNTSVGLGTVNKLFSATQTSDGFMLCGLTSANETSRSWVIKISFDGNIIWSKTFGTSDSALRTCTTCPDGNFLAAGYIAELQNPDRYDFLILKLDTSGNLLWNQTCGGNGSQKAYAMAKTGDGAVITGDGLSAETDSDAYIMKISFDGQIQWTKTVGGKSTDSPATIVASSDGGFLVAGFTFSFGEGYRDYWLTKIDNEGRVLWSCTLGDSAYQEAYGVIEISQDQFLLAGWTDPQGVPELVGKKTYDYWVVQVEIEAGFDLSNAKLAIWVATVAVWVVLAGVVAKIIFGKGKVSFLRA
ncbi:MAG: hypothetical protein NWF01_03250 [Candidatus Bathyarchaeota archaeon]|nr:hypothetical protein [Candidatus Bathyarchaeota archaeon]